MHSKFKTKDSGSEMSEFINPVMDGPATRRDILTLANLVETRFIGVDTKIDALDQKFEVKFDALGQKIDIINLSLRESIESLATRGNRKFIGTLIGFIGMIIAIVVAR